MTPLSYHSSNLSLIALETMRLLVQKFGFNVVSICLIRSIQIWLSAYLFLNFQDLSGEVETYLKK